MLAEERRRAYRHPAKRTRELIALLEDGPDLLDCPDTELCGALVAEIIVESNDTLRFRPPQCAPDARLLPDVRRFGRLLKAAYPKRSCCG